MSIGVLLCDGHGVVRAGFRMLLEAQPDLKVLGEAADGLQAVEMARRLRPDVVVMEIKLPKLDGIEVTRRVAGPAMERRSRVVILTMSDVEEHVIAALRAGAMGFLLKDDPSEELIRGIRTVAAGNASLAPSLTRRLIQRFAREFSARRQRPLVDLDLLTNREREVFRLIAEGLSNAEIADVLHLGEATIKSHVSALLMKLGLRDRVQAVIVAYRSGIVPATANGGEGDGAVLADATSSLAAASSSRRPVATPAVQRAPTSALRR